MRYIELIEEIKVNDGTKNYKRKTNKIVFGLKKFLSKYRFILTAQLFCCEKSDVGVV